MLGVGGQHHTLIGHLTCCEGGLLRPYRGVGSRGDLRVGGAAGGGLWLTVIIGAAQHGARQSDWVGRRMVIHMYCRRSQPQK